MLDVSSQTISDTSGNGYNFYLGATNVVNSYDPIRIPAQGYLFGKEMYISRAAATNLNLPQIFSVEAWVRFNTVEYNTVSTLQMLY